MLQTEIYISTVQGFLCHISMTKSAVHATNRNLHQYCARLPMPYQNEKISCPMLQTEIYISTVLGFLCHIRMTKSAVHATNRNLHQYCVRLPMPYQTDKISCSCYKQKSTSILCKASYAISE